MTDPYTRPHSERVLVCGQTESGKTYFLRNRVMLRHKRILILDRTGEWYVREPQAPSASNLGQCFGLLDAYAMRDRWRLIASLNNDDARIIAERLVGVPDVRQGYSYNVGGMALVLSEVDLLVPVANPPSELRSLWRRGSHAGLSVLADTQRPANVSKEASSQCQQLVFFGLYEPNDLRYMREQLGVVYTVARKWLDGEDYRCVVWDQHTRQLSLMAPSGAIMRTVDAKQLRDPQTSFALPDEA